MAETEIHRDLMMDLIQTLQRRLCGKNRRNSSENRSMMLLAQNSATSANDSPGLRFRQPHGTRGGQQAAPPSPDVFVVFGIPKRERIYYLVWDEGKGPDVVIELTSKSTRSEDQKRRRTSIETSSRSPNTSSSTPPRTTSVLPCKASAWSMASTSRSRPIADRLPGLLPCSACTWNATDQLRLFDPQTQTRLPTPAEFQAELSTRAATGPEAENDRLRQELEAMRKRLEGGA